MNTTRSPLVRSSMSGFEHVIWAAAFSSAIVTMTTHNVVHDVEAARERAAAHADMAVLMFRKVKD